MLFRSNPLFVEALLSCDGELSAELPESLRDLLLDSVRRLPDATQEVLRVASAGGETTGHALLAAVTGLDDDALTTALRPAVNANVLRVRADGYAFRHELIGEAVHSDLLPGEHGRLHSRFADAIDANPSLVPPGRAAIEMAHHWYLAHDIPWALIGSWQAAAQAERAVAPAERLSLLARVLDLWDQVPDAAERIGADHARVLEKATNAAYDAGEYERGIALATSALKELDPAAEPVRVAQLLEARGRFKMNLGRGEFHEDFAAALRTVPADSPAVRVPILLAAARCMPHSGDEYRSYAEEALALASEAGDEANQASALMSLAMYDAGDGQQGSLGSDPLELLTRARVMAERAGAHDLVAKAAVNESHLLEGAGHHEQAVEVARRGGANADSRYLARELRSLLAINEAEPLLALGRWDEALRLAEGAPDIQLTALPLHRAMLRIVKGQIALARGETGVAAEAVTAVGGLFRGSQYEDQHQLPFGALSVLLRLATAGPAAAIEATSQVIDDYEISSASPRYAWPVVVAGVTACLAGAAQARVARDERLRDEVFALAGRLRTIAEKLETFGRAQEANQLTFAAADAHVDYLLAAFPGTDEGAGAGTASGAGAAVVAGQVRAAWDQAAAAWTAVSEPYPLAQALLHAAETALGGGDRDGAAEALRRADGLAASLGARPLSEQIAVLARRARIALPGPGSSPGEAGPRDPGLTGRERDVLRLVAAGRSNREIAAELFISPKTASVHVSNILGKLGAASRGEAAAKAHELRLFELG